jgi:capsular polysaccharide biosynthesis protein
MAKQPNVTGDLIKAGGKLVGDVVVGLMQTKTQRDFNKAKVEQMASDSRLKLLTDSQRLALDKQIANAVNDTAKLRIYEETLSNLGVAAIESSGDLYKEKIKAEASPNKMIYITVGIGAALIIASVFLLSRKD